MRPDRDPYGQQAIVLGLLAQACREALDLSEDASEVVISVRCGPEGLSFSVDLADKGQPLAGFGG
jgi:hypothetical protein